MKIVCVGGGPAGLFAALLLQPCHDVTVIERHAPGAVSGWGVVLADGALARLAAADPAGALAIEAAFHHWDAIDVHVHGRVLRSHGHGFCGIGRARLLAILRARCMALGVRVVFEQDAQDIAAIAGTYGADLVLAADGIHSGIRTRYADTYRPVVEERGCRFVWLGTTRPFAAFSFFFEETAYGWFAAHAYQYDADMATFIVEVPHAAWLAAGLDRMPPAQAIALCERIFARHLDGHPLRDRHAPGASLWAAFAQVTCRRRVHRLQVDGRSVPVVLVGDAAHSAHFSIGSGTKLALDDATGLADALNGLDGAVASLPAALAAWEDARAVAVDRVQAAAENSMAWFEHVARYGAMAPEQCAYALLTRSQRVSHARLRARDPAYVMQFERWLAARAFADAGLQMPAHPVLPGDLPLRVRGVLLKNRCVVAQNGDAGGAALVMIAMTPAWRGNVDGLRAAIDARIGVQLGGSTGADAGPARAVDEYLRATHAAAAANVDWLELHCDGDEAEGCQGTLQIFGAVRAAWPVDRPISVRLSTRDGASAVRIARLFMEAGADMIACAAALSDRIRHEAEIATIATIATTTPGGSGARSDIDTIIAAGRADLCAVSR